MVVTNRLLPLPINDIGRRLILARNTGTQVRIYPPTYKLVPGTLHAIPWTGWEAAPGSGPSLAAIWAGPTREELDDLALIDSFYGMTKMPRDYALIYHAEYASYGGGTQWFHTPPDPNDYILDPTTVAAQMTAAWKLRTGVSPRDFHATDLEVRTEISRRSTAVAALPYIISDLLKDKFFNPGKVDVGEMTFFERPMRADGNTWGLTSLVWADNKQLVKNIIAFRKALKDYPWPKSLLGWQYGGKNWWRLEGPNILTMIHSGKDIEQGAFRLYTTVTLLSRAEEIAAGVQHDLESEARSDASFMKTKMIVMGVAAAAAVAIGGVIIAGAMAPTAGAGGAVAAGGAGGASAGASTLTTTLTTLLKTGVSLGVKALNAADAKNAASNMRDIQSKVQADDPAFAGEIDSTIEILNGAASISDDTSATIPEAQEYTVIVEGVEIGTYETADAAAKAITENSKRGDRVEVLADGKSQGLMLRTSDGIVAVPAENRDQVEAMTKDQVTELVVKAEAEQAKGGFPWWVLAAGGVAAAVL